MDFYNHKFGKLFLVFFLSVYATIGQTLTETLNSLDCPVFWKVDITSDSTDNQTFERSQMATVKFKTGKKQVDFLVFNYNEIDSTHFRKKRWNMMQVHLARTSTLTSTPFKVLT